MEQMKPPVSFQVEFIFSILACSMVLFNGGVQLFMSDDGILWLFLGGLSEPA